ncbi:hypothetical protein GALMADRAFT_224334 [Galerina marginata CBS 339.88]|uniref:HMG box domain-containing protein n=1 Tax=Galerina marginata (strain CBS 339.88) TaxID=685588 RepID=A0A067T3Z6_GALM3|nr:hypothetical protein GALMADRAFT_224334 [Galerina marginata CBS 339.88]
MPAVRPFYLNRRKSSHAIFSPAKPGIYGIVPRPSPHQLSSDSGGGNGGGVNVTFAPNVTPTTYTAPDPDDDPANPLPSLAADAEEDDAAGPNVKALRAQIFAGSEFGGASASAGGAAGAGAGAGGSGTGEAGVGGQKKRKRAPPGKRPSQGYIPRPPNAFMLYRADFVKQRHVPGNVEQNDASLSKVIGTCWRQLPLDEKRVWEKRAKEEKAAHKVRFPDYRFRPVHNKGKNAASAPAPASASTTTASTNTKSSSKSTSKPAPKPKAPTTADAEQRCEDISQLILEGTAGEELEEAIRIRDLEHTRSLSHSHSQSGNQGQAFDYEQGHDLQLGLTDITDTYDPYDPYAQEHEEPPDSRRTSVDLGFGATSPDLGMLPTQMHMHMHMPAPLHVPYGLGMDAGNGAFSAPAHTQLAFNFHLNTHNTNHLTHNGGAGLNPANMHTNPNFNANPNTNMSMNPTLAQALGRRRSSSVPLPNDWQWFAARSSISGPGSFFNGLPASLASFGADIGAGTGGAGGAGGIAIPSIPPFAAAERTRPHLRARGASPVGPLSQGGQGQGEFSQGHSHNLNQNPNMQAFQVEQFTNPFASSSSQQQQQQHNQGGSSFNFTQPAVPPVPAPVPAPDPNQGPFASVPHDQQHQPQGGIFQPSPQRGAFPLVSPRSSLGFGLGMRRASSAQAFGRPWPAGLENFDYRMSVAGSQLGMELGMGMGPSMPMGMSMSQAMSMHARMQMGMGLEIERDDSPLPEVESGLFADFSFGGGKAGGGGDAGVGPAHRPQAQQGQGRGHQRVSSLVEEAVDPVAPLATSTAPTSFSASSSSSTSVSSTSSPAITDVSPATTMGMGMGSHVPDNVNGGYMPVYAPIPAGLDLDPNSTMGAYGQQHQEQQGMYNMGMGIGTDGMYGFDTGTHAHTHAHSHNHDHDQVDPMVLSPNQNQKQPMVMVTEANFGMGSYFESA